MSQNTYHNQTGRFIAAVTTNMPALTGQQMQYWIQHPKALEVLLRTALRPRTPEFKLWKQASFDSMSTNDYRIQLGRVGSVEAGQSSLFSQILNSLDNGIGLFPRAQLAKITPAELGLEGAPSEHDIHTMALSYGLRLCPLEIGLHLALCVREPKSKLYIGMSPVHSGNRDHRVLRIIVDDDSVVWLHMEPAGPNRCFMSSDEFVFLLPENHGE
jgi:hypothetical protein